MVGEYETCFDNVMAKSIVLSERVLDIIVGKGFQPWAIYCIEWKRRKIIVWKDYGLGQSIVSNEREEKLLFERITALGNLLYRMKEKKNYCLKGFQYNRLP